MENIDIYFKDKTEHEQLEVEQVFDILLITFVDGNIEQLRRLDERAKKEQELSEQDQEKLHFFYILNHFFSKKYRDRALTKELVKNIIKNLEINKFILSDIVQKRREPEEEEEIKGLEEELDEKEF